MEVCSQCDKDGDFWDSGLFHYGKKVRVNTQRTDSGWETSTRFEIVGSHQVSFCSECRKGMVRKRWMSQMKLVASIFLYPLVMILVWMVLFQGRGVDGPSTIIQVMLVGFFVWAGWVFFLVIRNKSEIETLKGKKDWESLAQLLDKEAIRRFKTKMNSKEERGLTYWTRLEFKALEDSQAVHFP